MRYAQRRASVASLYDRIQSYPQGSTLPYTSPPQRWDHELIVGDTYQPAVVALTDSEGAAHDLTGATGEVQLRTEPGAALALSATWALVGSGSLGTFTWSASAASTASLAPGRYSYAVRVTFSDGSKRTVLEGTVTARRSVIA